MAYDSPENNVGGIINAKPSKIDSPVQVSLIATFYNVADYAQACVDSLLAQTYEQLEILLVDDGSTDRTAELLDSYANEPRVKIFHTQNGGPAAARNFGVEQARGQYISFVDGDDFVTPSYIEAMMKAASEGCDYVAVANAVLKEDDGVAALQDCPNTSFEAVLKDDAVEKLLYNQITESPWAKLFARELVMAHPFPKGRYYEDVAIAGRLLLSAQRPATIDAQLYGYRMRVGSVVHREQATIKQAEDFLWAIQQFLDPIVAARPGLSSAAAFRYLLEYSRLHSLLARVSDDSQRARKLDDFAISEMQALRPIVRQDGNVSLAQKARFGLLAANRRMYDAAFGAYEAVRKGVVRGKGKQPAGPDQPATPDQPAALGQPTDQPAAPGQPTQQPTPDAQRFLTSQEIQAEILELLKTFKAVCERHGLRFSLAGGTLLGAVRHQGFIPWDDDIDINMPRPDFDRLLKLRGQIEQETGCLVERCLSDVDDPLFVKLTNPRILVKEKYADVASHLWIDIFPMDGLPETQQETEKLFKRAILLRRMALMSHADINEGKTLAKRVVKTAFRPVDRLLSIGDRCESHLVALARQIPFGGTGYVGGLIWGYGPGERVPADSFENMPSLRFEDAEFPAINSWDAYLVGLYGDYMELPPESARIGHEMQAWYAQAPK